MIVATDYDPLAHGYVTSLARPSGNITGVFPQQIELAKKRLQIFTEALPDLQTATMFWDASSEDQWKAMSAAAGGFGLRLVGVELLGERPYDYQAALMQAPLDHRGALITPTSPAFYRDRERLAELALRHRIASIFGFREWVEAGGLLSYGSNTRQTPCVTCRTDRNFTLHERASYRSIPGHPRWMAAPRRAHRHTLLKDSLRAPSVLQCSKLLLWAPALLDHSRALLWRVG